MKDKESPTIGVLFASVVVTCIWAVAWIWVDGDSLVRFCEAHPGWSALVFFTSLLGPTAVCEMIYSP